MKFNYPDALAYPALTHLKSSYYPFTFFPSLVIIFYQDGDIAFYGDVRDEARALIGCRPSPMRPPH